MEKLPCQKQNWVVSNGEKTMKRMTEVLLITLIMLMNAVIYVNAADKVYYVDSADFYVKLEGNGDALIRETWKVTFEKGEFSRFYKDIYCDVTDLESFDRIEEVSCYINNIKAAKSNAMNRVDYHYYTEYIEPDTYRINWFLNTSKSTVTYEITYRLKNVVKQTDNNTALFCYRFIGLDFPKSVGKVYINIEIPNDSTPELRFISMEADTICSTGRIELNVTEVNDLLKCNIAIDAEGFHNLNYISLEEIKRGEQQSQSGQKSGISGNGIISLVSMVFLVLIANMAAFFCKKYKSLAVRKKLKANPDYFKRLIENCENDNIHPLEIAAYSGKRLHAFNIMKIILLDACRKNSNKKPICKITYNTIRFDKELNDGNYCTKGEYATGELLRIFKENFKYRLDTTAYEFHISDITDFLNRNKHETLQLSKLISDLSNIYQIFFNHKDSKIKSNIGIRMESDIKRQTVHLTKKECKMLEYYIITREKVLISGLDCFCFTARTNNIDYTTILHLMFCPTAATRVSASELHNSIFKIAKFCEILDEIELSWQNEISTQDNSGCSGCSSCSSCSGCGGGGAD